MASITSILQGRHVRRIAILNKKNLANHPYDKWISDADPAAEVLLFAQNDVDSRAYLSLSQHKYAYTALFDSWKNSRLPDINISEMHKEFPFSRIVALSECDVIRASELRGAHGIDGMKSIVARAFRDKFIMKQLASNAGLEVPTFVSVSSVSDLIDFSEKNPGPMVIKPIDGAGAVGIYVIQDKRDLQNWISTQRQVRDEPIRYIVETYVDAPIVTVDGIMASGKILAAMTSSYQGTCLDAVKFQRPLALLQLDPECDSAKRALDYASRLIASFPTPEESTSFHLELFDTQSGPLLCEIAARTGGGRINDLAINALGIDLEQWSCLGQAGLSPQVVESIYPGNSSYYGFLLLPQYGGLLVSAPLKCPLEGVMDYRLHYNVGELIAPNKKASNAVADVLFMAPNVTSLHTLYENIVEWYTKSFRWSS